MMGLIIIGLTACNSDEEKAVMNMVENTKIAESTAEEESTAEQESTGSEEYSTDESNTDENEAGQVKEESNWYEYEAETGDKGFISGEYLVVNNPLQQEVAQKSNTPEQPKQEQPKQEQTQQPPVQEQQPPYDDEHLPPGVLPGQAYDPETGRVWQPGDVMGDGGIYLGDIDDYVTH